MLLCYFVYQTDTELWTFQEIAFKAEMDRHDDPESEEEAFILCAEDPASRTRNIVELRNMIYGKQTSSLFPVTIAWKSFSKTSLELKYFPVVITIIVYN